MKEGTYEYKGDQYYLTLQTDGLTVTKTLNHGFIRYRKIKFKLKKFGNDYDKVYYVDPLDSEELYERDTVESAVIQACEMLDFDISRSPLRVKALKEIEEEFQDFILGNTVP